LSTLEYAAITRDLQFAYDRKVEERQQRSVQAWKHTERTRFLQLLLASGKRTLVDIGAGTGIHAQFFADVGLRVVCTDLSPAMVAACQSRGLTALQQDVATLALPEPCDAAFAMNSLLHVPDCVLPEALLAVHNALKPGGLFYLGQYGGTDQAGIAPRDDYEPKRFFSFLSDAKLTSSAALVFEVLDFRTVELEDDTADFHFQALTLRRR
jgi:SAM-dependent methyltransferase